MVAHAGTLSVFGRHGRRSDRRAAVVAVRSQRTIIVIISTRRDDAAFRLSGAVSIVVLLIVCVGISDAQLTVTHDGAVCVDSTAEKPVCECAGNEEETRQHTPTHGVSE